MTDDDKIVSLTGAPLHFCGTPGQLFDLKEVVDGLVENDAQQAIVIGRLPDGRLYVGSTHSTETCSLLLGQAQHFIHKHYEV
ncbi:hypothetical protein [Roseovarius nitratireducens]|uniref:hypothetical protein n=1 Tax=Roseovarius nitratireducens TaxID=2044597 RepID=UPI000CE18E3D|nr:hypothetical protein [Roseovarius nitratireducens]